MPLNLLTKLTKEVVWNNKAIKKDLYSRNNEKGGKSMSLPLYTFVAGISGVFIGMILLQIFVTLSSKLAIYIDNKGQTKEK